MGVVVGPVANAVRDVTELAGTLVEIVPVAGTFNTVLLASVPTLIVPLWILKRAMLNRLSKGSLEPALYVVEPIGSVVSVVGIDSAVYTGCNNVLRLCSAAVIWVLLIVATVAAATVLLVGTVPMTR